ncbi:heme biosynthesis protein HemY [Shewanella sp. NFH-SH190041]|uniref:heme biosynthesis HemY N-terminal domain-containing protein n=1 Tax=Shewanella sp. NFH-SH190041 TaxID=2950245 RepID=UPI0021C38DE0|nr:heme biosynthesis HemY N-terminal domain-containing protein [Shewanella sp. NFH-SH190041]BDM62939.1 heme biosynthesis protein HemY [Shewanella sp. NFH-SH190041]
MIRSLAYLLIILVGLCLSPYIIGNTGRVFIEIGHYQITTSVVFSLLAILVFYGAVQIVEWLLVALLNLLLSSRLLPERWKRHSARKQTLTGVLALAEQDWPAAEVAMAKSAAKAQLPVLNLLAAARAAQHQGKSQTRDQYLAEAELQPQAKQAVMIARCRYLQQDGNWQQAAEQLALMTPGNQSPQPVLQLALTQYRQQQNWAALAQLLPAIKKKQLLNEQQYDALSVQIFTAQLSAAAATNAQQLEKCWRDLPRAYRSQHEFIAIYAPALARFNQQAQAIKLLQKALHKHASIDLIRALCQILQKEDNQALLYLQELEAQRSDNGGYHRAMAEMYQRLREFKQAKYHWQRACELTPNADCWLALGELQQQLGDDHGALNSFHRAAQIR